MEGFPQVCFINNTVKNPNIIIGDYTYYDDVVDSENFERNVLYHYPFIGDKLIIGKFCALATGVKFIMNGANHKTSGISTYPFSIFRNGWEKVMPKPGELPYRGDTVVGNDATIMPGVKIGHGAIIASKSVVFNNVKPYSIVGGNPAEFLRMRFSPEQVSKLLQLAWWDWDIEKITRNLEKITGGDVEALFTAD